MNSVRRITGMVVTAAVICIAGPAHIACADEKIITPERTCSLAIHYLDNVDGTDPIAGAEFTYYRVAEYSQEAFDNSTGILWRSVIPIDEKERALLEDGTEAAEIEEQTLESYSGGIPKGGMTGTMKTDANGNAHASGLLQGIYLIRETKSASGHLPSGSFLMAVPFTKTETGSGESVQSWCYEAEAEPKPQPCGELIIVKTVRGSGSDLKTDFHFKVILEEDGPHPCIRADGEEDIISSGDVVALKGGESFLIGNLPAGSRYKVTEQEANQNGYLTTETGTSGRIIRSELARAVFVNEKNVSGAPVSGSPAVTSTPTRTPTPEPTTTSAKTPTPVPTSTPTRKPTPAPTSTPTATPTPEPTSKSTVTPTPSPTGKPKNENTSTDGEKGNTGNKSTGTSGGSYQSTAVKTGDESKAEIWIFLCLISMAVAAFSFIWRRNS